MRLFFKVLKKTGLEKKFNFSIPRILNGSKVIIPVLGEIGKGNLYARELWMHTLLKELLDKKAGMIVDVGVNIGQTLIHYKTAFPSRDYIGFEPNPDCIFYTNKLIQANKWRNCSLIPCAVFERSELLEINYYSAATDSMASVVENFRSDRKVIKKEWVAAFDGNTISRLLTGKQIGVLKIDVEGAELEVLLQLSAMIITQRSFVIVELLLPQKGNEETGWQKINAIHDFFEANKYAAVRILKNTDSSLAGLERVMHPSQGLTRKNADHLYCPEELWPLNES
ncbi:MAG: FkbM family methyltransferase [Chitinophagaceae bacterium]|nr:FkbM family methyltransferase [Chitinophagaceae bacterium]